MGVIKSYPKVYYKKCKRCRYFNDYIGCCDYAQIVRKTRLFLHLGEDGNINEPCREYAPKIRKGGESRVE